MFAAVAFHGRSGCFLPIEREVFVIDLHRRCVLELLVDEFGSCAVRAAPAY